MFTVRWRFYSGEFFFFFLMFFLGHHICLFSCNDQNLNGDCFACVLWLLPDFLIYTDDEKQAERQMRRRWPWNICQWYDSWPGLDWLDSKWWTGRRAIWANMWGRGGKGGWNNSMLYNNLKVSLILYISNFILFLTYNVFGPFAQWLNDH